MKNDVFWESDGEDELKITRLSTVRGADGDSIKVFTILLGEEVSTTSPPVPHDMVDVVEGCRGHIQIW